MMCSSSSSPAIRLGLSAWPGLMDRPIRPLFPEWFHDEVQIQAFVLASDRQHDSDVLAMNAGAASLGLSELPFQGPLASVRLGRVDGQLVPFPTQDELEESELDLIVSGTKDAVLMIEGFAREMPEDQMIEALAEAHRIIGELCDLQIELFEKAGVVKKEYEVPPPDGVYERVRDAFYHELKTAKQTPGKQARADAVHEVKAKALGELIPDQKAEGAISLVAFGHAWHKLEEHAVRDLILDGKRTDGRDTKTVRADRLRGRRAAPRARLGPLPARRDAGAGHRHAGHRRATSSASTAWSRSTARSSCCTTTSRRSASARCRPIRGPGRREIGHGALAERSLKAGHPAAGEVPLHHPRRLRHPRVQRLQQHGQRLRRHPGADGRRRADQRPGGRHLHRPGQGSRRPAASCSPTSSATRTTSATWTSRSPAPADGITGIQLDLKIDGISEEIIRAALAAGPRGPPRNPHARC